MELAILLAAAGLGLAYSAGPGVVRWIGAFSGLALGYFGLRLLWETLAAALERPGAASSLLRRVAEFGLNAREARKAAVA